MHGKQFKPQRLTRRAQNKNDGKVVAAPTPQKGGEGNVWGVGWGMWGCVGGGAGGGFALPLRLMLVTWSVSSLAFVGQ